MNRRRFLPLKAITLVTMLGTCGQQKAAPVVGTLTAYYATADFHAGETEYKKGQLICDSNDPLNRIVEKDAGNYMYEGDDTGAYYSWLLPKSKVEKKTYTMNLLTVGNVGKNAVFQAKNGCKARIFRAVSNGHRYYNWDGTEQDISATDRFQESFVLSAEIINRWDGDKYLFEEQLEEEQGSITLYYDNRFAEGVEDPENCRYRKGKIGIIEESWNNSEGWDASLSAYSADGKLLTDQWAVADIAEYISIAYIADLDALYINGELYYRCNHR